MAQCTCADPTAVANAIKQHASKTEDVNKTLYGSGHGGKDGVIDSIRFCHWAAPEWGAKGESAWNKLFTVAQLAVAVANALAQQEIADKKQDLAESYYQMAEDKWNRFKNKYMPLEKKLLNEVSTEPVKTLDCADDRRRAEASVNPAYTQMQNYLRQLRQKLQLCPDDTLVPYLETKQAVSLVDTVNYNMQDDQWFVDYSNDKRWNRRSNILNLGRNLTSEALKYGDVARNLYNQVGQQIDQAANSLMATLGYYGARNDTFYPTTFLGSSGRNDGGFIVSASPGFSGATGALDATGA